MRVRVLAASKRRLKTIARSARTSEFFWKCRNAILLLWFRILRRGFYAGNWLDGKKRDVGVGWSILRGGFYSSVLAIALFLITEYADKVVAEYAPPVHQFACDLTRSLLDFLALTIHYNSGAVSGLLGSVCGISGVFLGLYFTAISIGAGQQLGSMNLNLRNLVVSERFGTKYINYLTILALFAFLLWLKIAIAGEVTLLSLSVVIIFSIYLIAGFYPLGKRSFFLAEPYILADPLFIDIYLYFGKLKKRDLLSSYGPIEDYFRRTVRGNILTIRQVMKLALEKGERGLDNAKHLTGRLIEVLLRYRAFKQDISTESKWFNVIPKHENWLYPDTSKEQMLHNLGVISQPPTVPDRDWLEKEVTVIVAECLKSYVNEKSPNALVSIFEILRSYLSRLAEDWDLDQAITHYQLFESVLYPIFEANEVDVQLKLQLLELLGLCRIDISIHALKSITDLKVEGSVCSVTAFSFGKVKAPGSGIPNSVRVVADHLIRTLRFEKAVEGTWISRDWYVQQLIARAYATELKRIYSRLLDFVDPHLSSDQSFDGSVMVAMKKQRELELVTRIERIRGHFIERIEELKRFEKIADLPIESMPKDFEAERIERLRIIQLDSLAGVLVHIYRPTRDDSIPDFFGICFRQLVLELFNRAKNNNLQGFKALFPKVFLAAFLAKDRLVAEHNGQTSDQMAQIRITLEPIVDLLHLSGYAAAFADLHGNPEFLNIVLTSWKSLRLKDLDTPTKILNWILTVHSLQHADFRMTKTSHLRFSWKQGFEDLLRKKGFIREDRFGYGNDDRGVLPIPDKPLLKAICDGGYEPIEDPTEWFIVASILAENLDPKTLDLSSVRFWADHLRSERKG